MNNPYDIGELGVAWNEGVAAGIRLAKRIFEPQWSTHWASEMDTYAGPNWRPLNKKAEEMGLKDFKEPNE